MKCPCALLDNLVFLFSSFHFRFSKNQGRDRSICFADSYSESQDSGGKESARFYAFNESGRLLRGKYFIVVLSQDTNHSQDEKLARYDSRRVPSERSERYFS